MKHRSVVANFIFQLGTDGHQKLVALFCRSNHPNVRSYKLVPYAFDLQALSHIIGESLHLSQEASTLMMQTLLLRHLGSFMKRLSC
jgi:hypothetical protein